MSRILTVSISTLMLLGCAPTYDESAMPKAGTAPEGIKLQAYEPGGKGDPNAISCWAYRTTPPVRGLRCARNSYWARLNAGSHSDLGGDLGIPTGAMSPGAAGGAVSGRN